LKVEVLLALFANEGGVHFKIDLMYDFNIICLTNNKPIFYHAFKFKIRLSYRRYEIKNQNSIALIKKESLLGSLYPRSLL
jgi:hypothetical protein